MDLLSLFRTRKFTKYVSVYISKMHSQIIIVPLSQEGFRGVISEQGDCEVIPFHSSLEEIGLKIKRNLDYFIIDKNRQLTGKIADWPALKSSKERSKVAFEKSYRRFMVSGENEYNIILKIETESKNFSEIRLKSSISAYCNNEDLGKLLMKLYNSEVCKDEIKTVSNNKHKKLPNFV